MTRQDPLTFLQSLSGFVRAEAGRESANRAPVFATIDPDYDPALGQLPQVTFDGESTVSGRRYAYLNTYRPTADDRVLMMPVGYRNYVIIGSVELAGETGFAADPATGTYTTYFGEDSYVQVDSGEAFVRINGRTIHPNCAGVNAANTVTENTSSTSFANMSGPSSFTFTKREDGTRVRIDFHTSLEVGTIGNTKVELGVRIDGVDYAVVNRHINPVSEKHTVSGVAFLTGINAGVYTVQARWRRSGGTGALARYATDDWLSIAAMEVDAS